MYAKPFIFLIASLTFKQRMNAMIFLYQAITHIRAGSRTLSRSILPSIGFEVFKRATTLHSTACFFAV
jgi:hypothetical protein